MTKVNGVLEDLIPEKATKVKIRRLQPRFSEKIKNIKEIYAKS